MKQFTKLHYMLSDNTSINKHQCYPLDTRESIKDKKYKISGKIHSYTDIKIEDFKITHWSKKKNHKFKWYNNET